MSAYPMYGVMKNQTSLFKISQIFLSLSNFCFVPIAFAVKKCCG